MQLKTYGYEINQMKAGLQKSETEGITVLRNICVFHSIALEEESHILADKTCNYKLVVKRRSK